MTTSELIRHEGYPCEEHTTTTQDGFVLTLHRIARGHPAGQAALPGARPPVLVMHGLMQDSEVWCTNGRQGSLAFLLADAGFDVWLGNNRANKYSSKHLRFRDTDDAYWDFSFDEMARFDVPSMVNYILRRTGQRKVSYVGFSQGTAQAFAAFSTDPDLASKISTFAALSPAATVQGLSRSVIASLVSANTDFIFTLFGRHAMLPYAHRVRQMVSPAMHVQMIDACLRYLFGWDVKELDPEEKQLMYAHIFSYSSVKCVVHWFQVIRSRRFQMFAERDRSRNHVAPTYDVATIQCPIALFTGGKDTTIDSERLIQILRTSDLHKDVFVHHEPTYEHLDFMWAKSARERAFPALISQLWQNSDWDDIDSVASYGTQSLTAASLARASAVSVASGAAAPAAETSQASIRPALGPAGAVAAFLSLPGAVSMEAHQTKPTDVKSTRRGSVEAATAAVPPALGASTAPHVVGVAAAAPLAATGQSLARKGSLDPRLQRRTSRRARDHAAASGFPC